MDSEIANMEPVLIVSKIKGSDGDYKSLLNIRTEEDKKAIAGIFEHFMQSHPSFAEAILIASAKYSENVCKKVQFGSQANRSKS